jgi:predicted RNase H-like HicB family nuclease
MTVGAVGEPDVGYFHSNTIVGMPADSQPDIEFCGGLVNEYTAIIKQDGDWWIGWIEEVPGVNCQEATREELLETLAITLREILESNKEDAIAAAGEDYQEERIAL